MKVSIVTISRNQGRYLDAALASVLAQTHPDIEYIVVDAGSTDNSAAVISSRRHQLSAVIAEPDDGPAAGLNKGLARSTGEIFGYLNADDLLMPDAVAAAVTVFSRNPAVDIVYGHGLLIDTLGRPVRRLRSPARFQARRAAFGGGVPVQPATFLRRAAVLAAGGFNALNRSCWDYELLIDLALRGSGFMRVHQTWAAHRRHADALSVAAGFDRLLATDENRIFARVMGRPPRRSDALVRAAVRLEKWLRDPVSAAVRLRDAIGPAP